MSFLFLSDNFFLVNKQSIKEAPFHILHACYTFFCFLLDDLEWGFYDFDLQYYCFFLIGYYSYIAFKAWFWPQLTDPFQQSLCRLKRAVFLSSKSVKVCWSLLWEESLFSIGNKCTFWASGILILSGLWGDTLFLGPFLILNLMEELANQLTNFSLSEKETVGFTLSKEQRSNEYLLVAQFLTPRFLNMEAMARTFKQLWRSTNRFTICNQNEHRVLFVFDNPNDIERILKNQPWSFDKHLVMLQRYSTDCPIRDLVFSKTLFWVQVHDIPIWYMTKEVAENIYDIVGEVQKSASAVTDEGGHFIRVWVMIDITLPLCQGRVITLENGLNHWVRFKYERLPNLCGCRVKARLKWNNSSTIPL